MANTFCPSLRSSQLARENVSLQTKINEMDLKLGEGIGAMEVMAAGGLAGGEKGDMEEEVAETGEVEEGNGGEE